MTRNKIVDGKIFNKLKENIKRDRSSIVIFINKNLRVKCI